MPSYAHDVKKELSLIFDEEKIYLSELAGLIKIGARNFDGRIEFENANAAVVRKVIILTKKIYPLARTEISAIRKKNLSKTMRYMVKIFKTDATEELFKNIDSLEITRKKIQKISWLRGAFLAGGRVNRPEAQYYLDITSLNEESVKMAKKIFESLYFRVRFRTRYEEFVVHMSESDSIYEFLRMIGANETLDRFDSARNLKEIRANVNRIMNCDRANVNKIVDAAQRQLSDIRLIKKEKIEVKEIIMEAMKIRLENPSLSIGELAEKIFITREGLTYRFKKIHKIAEKIRQKK